MQPGETPIGVTIPVDRLAIGAVAVLYGALAIVAVGRELDGASAPVDRGAPAAPVDGRAPTGAPAIAADSAAAPRAAGVAGAPRTGTRGAGDGTPATGPAPAGEPVASTGRIPANGPGVSDDEIEIGIETLTNVGAAYAAIGYEGAIPTDQDIRNVAAAIAEAVNRRGGLAGRQMVPVLHFSDITNGTHDSRGQVACSFFTEDHPVFAVVAQGNHGDAFSSCLAQRRVPLIDDANSLPLDDADLARLAPYVWAPDKLGLSRFGAYIDTLAAGRFFDPGSRVGLLRYDTANQERTRDEVIVPALARHGLELADEFAFSPAQSVSDLSIAAAQATNAAVRFRGSDIDRVIFLPSAGVITTVFPVAAEDQQYRPRYGISTAELPTNMATNSPPGQLEDALLVGWSTSADRGSDFVNEGNPLWVFCRDVMRERGTLEAGAYGCGPYFFLQEALARATHASPEGIRAGADLLGRTPWSTRGYATNIRPQRYDGTGAVLLHVFDDACTCFEPAGRVTEIE